MLKIEKSDPLYPDAFSRLQKPPSHLYLEGTPELLNRNYISVVGSRNPRLDLKQWMEHELLPVLKSLCLGVISGGARGVDQWAHFLALRANQPTLVVLPSGLSNKYPGSIQRLVGNPLVGFLSSYEPHQEMRKHHFHSRNHLIAALSQQILIIQAGEKSGTMMTARSAMEQGHDLLVLPGNPQDPTMAGNNQLLFDGAQMIRNQGDLHSFLQNSIGDSKKVTVP